MNKGKEKMIEKIRKDFISPCLKGSDGCNVKDCQHCHAEALYNAGYRKVGEDEVVVKKSEYKQLNRDTKRFRLKWQLAEQEKREILQDIMTRITYLDSQFLRGIKYFYVNEEYIEELAKKYGIELE